MYILALENVPNALPDQGVGVVILLIVFDPIFYFPIDAVFAQVADTDDRF